MKVWLWPPAPIWLSLLAPFWPFFSELAAAPSGCTQLLRAPQHHCHPDSAKTPGQHCHLHPKGQIPDPRCSVLEWDAWLLLRDRNWAAESGPDRLCSWESPRLERGYLSVDVHVRSLGVI